MREVAHQCLPICFLLPLHSLKEEEDGREERHVAGEECQSMVKWGGEHEASGFRRPLVAQQKKSMAQLQN